MGDENAELTDLWGDPWTPPKDRRGRKSHRWLKQVAENVAVLKASGLTVELIASRIGLSEPTLRKYYFRELDEGAGLAQAVLNEAMWKKALAGNVGAARYIREEFGKGDVKTAANRVREREQAPVALGKKEERKAAAGRVSGRFATPAAPKLVVSNS
ncbi:hypothetical protein D3C71_230930 [compost metagenome]